jgi:polyisoprenoid-binding protein YceI
MKKYMLILLPAVLLISAGEPAKDTYILTRDYTVTIDGTMNRRDWQEKVGEVTGEMTAVVNEDKSVELTAIRISMQVLSIKSDMGRLMDKKTYEALKAAAYPEILFTLNAPLKLTQVRDRQTAIPVRGQLALAGVSKPMIMLVKTFAISQGVLQFEGSQTITMRDYGVRPPTALFGTMRSGPDITIHFKTNFLNQSVTTTLKN